MTYVALGLALLAAMLHVVIFAMESLLWTRETIWRLFGLKTQDQARLTRQLAFNQGFYNLFLAIGTGSGVILVLTDRPAAGWALIIFGCASMVAAAVVLLSTGAKYLRAALTQAGFPLLALLAAAVVRLV